jgi:hypothetical protein
MGQRFSWLRGTAWSVVVAAVGALSVGSEASLAASGWVPAQDIAPVGASSASQPRVVLDRQGNAIAVWRRGAASGGDVKVQSAFRPAGGPWQAPVDISRPGPDGEEISFPADGGPQVAVDAQGNAIAVWQRHDGTSLVVQAAERPAGGAWRTPVDISGTGHSGDDSRNARIVMDPSGTALVVWLRRDPATGKDEIRSAEHARGGTWQAPVEVSPSGALFRRGIELVIDARGTALALWAGTSNSVALASSTHPAGGVWQAPESIPDSPVLVIDFDVAVDSQGNAVASWTQGGIGGPNSVRAAVRPAAGTWQPSVVLGTDAEASQVATDDAGNTTVVFEKPSDEIRSATRPAGGDWQPDVLINPGGHVARLPALILDARGDATAAWTDATGPRPSIMTARRVGADWQPPVRLTADERSAAEPDLAVDPQGNGVAVWSESTSGVISAAGFDATAPEFRGLTVPASGAAGRPLAFSATPFDTWSAPLATSWRFGDGASATGNAVSHTYNVVGRQTLAVTTTDLVGNTVGGTKSILIKPSVLGLRVSPNAFRRRRPGTLSFRLAAASTVRFGVERVRIGRTVGKRCVTATRANRARARCTRYVRVGSFSRSRRSGSTRLKMPTRIAGRLLAAGRYRLSAVPRAAGLTGNASRSGFRITG